MYVRILHKSADRRLEIMADITERNDVRKGLHGPGHPHGRQSLLQRRRPDAGLLRYGGFDMRHAGPFRTQLHSARFAAGTRAAAHPQPKIDPAAEAAAEVNGGGYLEEGSRIV